MLIKVEGLEDGKKRCLGLQGEDLRRYKDRDGGCSNGMCRTLTILHFSVSFLVIHSK